MKDDELLSDHPASVRFRARYRKDSKFRKVIQARIAVFNQKNPESHRLAQRKYSAKKRESSEYNDHIRNYQLLLRLSKGKT